MTPKALQEIKELKEEVEEANKLTQKYRDLQNKYRRLGYPGNVRDYRKKELQEERKYYKYKEKIDKIKKFGYSTKELTAIKKSLHNFVTLSSERSLGSRDRKEVGYVKPLDKYFIIEYVKFSQFMRNVKGASGLAGQIDILNLKEIPKHVYEKIMRERKQKSSTSFMGASEHYKDSKRVYKNQRAQPQSLGDALLGL